MLVCNICPEVEGRIIVVVVTVVQLPIAVTRLCIDGQKDPPTR